MRFYRLLLHLYPSSFRAAYGEELMTVFAAESQQRGRLLSFLAAIADVIPNAVAVHWEVLMQDLRFAARSLGRSPGFAITALLVTALGVGANTAAFTLADFVLVRPLPFREPERLIKIYESAGGGYNEFSPANYRDLKDQARSFEGMAAYTWGAANLVGTGEPRRLETIAATPELLPLLGVQPLLGRFFTARDALAERPLILSYAVWQSQFGGDPTVIGRAVRLDGTPGRIVAVMPASFQFPRRGVEAWIPLIFDAQAYEDRGNTYIEPIARIRKGVTVDEARRELDVIAARLEKQYPENREKGVYTPLLREQISKGARLLVLALCGAALCILLLACANLASLFLARGAHRARELAVRSALGAGRERLVRQLITESFAIAAAGGIIGIILAAMSVRLLVRLVPTSLPVADLPGVDGRLLALAAGFVVFTGLAFGVLPALRVSGGGDFDALRAGARTTGGRTQRLRSVLVVVEIVSSVVLLVSAGLLIRAVWNIQSRDPGFRAENVLTVRTALSLPKYDPVALRVQFYRQVLGEVRALPGVTGAAYITGLPMQMRGGIWTPVFGGVEPPRDGSHDVSIRFVTPQFFSTLGIPLRRGRDFTENDGQKQPYVVVVSESFVEKHYPNENPIGKHFKIGGAERTIVGVVGDVRVRGLERQSEPQMYLGYQQVEDANYIGYIPKALVVKTTAAPESMVGAIRGIVRRADPEQPVSDVSTLADILSDETASRVTQVRLLGAMALIALLIAAVGIHGLLAYSVSRRLPELGVRRALGAGMSTLVKLVIREGIVLAAIGIAIGVFVAYAAARSMGALLAEIAPSDPLTFLTATALCFLMVLIGCVRPALRAGLVDPMIALRAE